jgi:hypothetical protein
VLVGVVVLAQMAQQILVVVAVLMVEVVAQE